MGLYGAMDASVSGLTVQGQALGMISDNIINMRTVGYKRSDTAFSTLVTNQTSPTTYSSGSILGYVRMGVDQQGGQQGTSNVTDMALNGSGMFVVTDHLDWNPLTEKWDVGGDIFYTRAASFTKNKDGNLVNTAGYYLVGWGVGDDGEIERTPVIRDLIGINVGNTNVVLPQYTENIKASLNLAATSKPGALYSTSLQIVDKVGIAKTLDFTFEKTVDPNKWRVSVSVSGAQFLNPKADATGAMAADTDNDGDISPEELANATSTDFALAGSTNVYVGDIEFTDDGLLKGYNFPAGYPAGSGIGTHSPLTLDASVDLFVSHSGSLASLSDATRIRVSLGNLLSKTGVTQVGDFSLTNTLEGDGKQMATLKEIYVDQVGMVTGLFDNEEERELYQIPVAKFRNYNKLVTYRGNAYSASDDSGEPSISEAGRGSVGTIANFALETSTVDIATEFALMIQTQRAYSASARVISTASDMLSELVQVVH